MTRIGALLRGLLRRRTRGAASYEARTQGPYRTEADEHGVRAEPARVVFRAPDEPIVWVAEDAEGLLVAGFDGLARLCPGEPAPRQLMSTRWVLHYALGPRGVVWLEQSDRRTVVWWIEAGQGAPRRIAESVGSPGGIVAHEDGVYWGTEDPEFDPDDPKIMLRANARILRAGFDGGRPTEVLRSDRRLHPWFADSEGVAWHELTVHPVTVRVFAATSAGVAETTRFSLAPLKDPRRSPEMTIDASAVYAYDRRAGGLVVVPRRGGEPRLLARSQLPALALAPGGGALYAIVGDPRRAPREIWRVDLATAKVKVLGHFVAEDGLERGEYSHYKLAVGRDAVYVYGGRKILGVPRGP